MEEARVKKINGFEVKFIHYPENRVVIAEVKGCAEDVFQWLEQKCGLEYSIFCRPGTPTFMNEIYLPRTLKAVAKCHPEDDFDIRVGEDVAYKKLQKKYWEKYSVRCMKLYKHLTATLESLSDEIRKAATKAQAINPTANVKS